NKVRLVAQGHIQEEGINYEEFFAPVARIKAIRLLLAYASFMGFIVDQMVVKSAFLYGTIDEEVYVMQPPGFQDSQFLDRVYKVENAMYGLHQAPRAWYGTLSKYLLANGFQRATIHQKTNLDLLQFCLFLCFLSQEEPKKIFNALKDPSWVEAMQEKLLQFKIQNVWILVDCPKGVRPIGTKWVLKNKKDERGIVIRNKVRLVAQEHIQEEGINYEEFFAPVARIEAIRLLLAYASFMGFIIDQMVVKSAFLYGTIDEEVYVM
nr:retrovirus-related Pol polyprotein from transposon TNT 1-94 [Tanacetum cinerariifolium]